MKPPANDPKFAKAKKVSAGAALYYSNTVSAVKDLVAKVRAGGGIPAVSADSGKNSTTDWRSFLQQPENRRRAREALQRALLSNSTKARLWQRGPLSPSRLKLVASAVDKMLADAPLPAAYDLRSSADFRRISSVKDQGECGSCVAFANMAALESTILVASRGSLVEHDDLSEARAFFCDWNAKCSDGFWNAEAAKFINEKGAIQERCAPYIDRQPPDGSRCAASCDDRPPEWFSAVFLGTDVEAIKRHIYQYGSVASGFDVYDDFSAWGGSSACKSSVWPGTSTGRADGGHAISIVGWGDGFWIVKNSWRSDWCDGGFFRIRFGVDAFGTDTWGYIYGGGGGGDCESQGKVQCPDGSCADDLESCASVPSCESSGGYLCDDGTCVSGPEECGGTGETCEDNDQVTCGDGSTCASSYDECPDTSCEAWGMVTCAYDGSCSWSDDECPQAPTSCEDGGQVTCPDGSCADNDYDCVADCESNGFVTCADGSCAESSDECGGVEDNGDQSCEWYGYVTCWNGECASEESECPEDSCENYGQVTCYDMSCADGPEYCPEPDLDSCETWGFVTCPDGECGQDEGSCSSPSNGFDTCEDYGLETCPDGYCTSSLDLCDYYERKRK
ncbi:hypothetical protein DFJ74DRAFT_714642 [Hyaloraphidium curvatum]|nr:hypothetical protein DFJ74DRAFT_714642 [Hyaloraphidium curvatum]